MTRSITELVADLIAAGAEPAVAALVVVAAYERGSVCGQSADSLRTSDDKRRERDKLAKREKRAKSKLLKQQTSPLSAVAERPETSADSLRTNADIDQSISFLLPSENGNSEEEVKKEKKKEVSARARGTRLPDDWRPDEAGWKFAADRGHSSQVIEDEILKFRNYWTNRTDKQACKPRWDRAWQNWVLGIKGSTNVIQKPAANGLATALRGLRQHIAETDRGEDGSRPPPRLLSHG